MYIWKSQKNGLHFFFSISFYITLHRHFTSHRTLSELLVVKSLYILKIIFHPMSVEHIDFISIIYFKYKVNLSVYCINHMNDETWIKTAISFKRKHFKYKDLRTHNRINQLCSEGIWQLHKPHTIKHQTCAFIFGLWFPSKPFPLQCLGSVVMLSTLHHAAIISRTP